MKVTMSGISLAVALLGAVAAALGVFARGDGAFAAVTSARGEAYEMATTGVYAWSAKQLVAEGVGWDVFTLAVAVPALLVAAWLVARGSFRGRLAAIGILGYFVYQYLEYTLTWAFGPLFLLHIAIYGTSMIGIILIATSLFHDRAQAHVDRGFPSRGWAVLSVAMAAMLALMWLRRIVSGLSGDPTLGALDGETTMVVQALDLGLVLPALVLSGLVAWRRSTVGSIFASVLSVSFTAMAAAIACMLVSAGIVNGTLEIAPLTIFAMAAAAAGILAIRMYRSIGQPDAPDVQRPSSLRASQSPA
jgi:hypothetical protein